MTTLYCFDMFWPCWNVQPSSPQAQGCSSWIHIAAFSGSGVFVCYNLPWNCAIEQEKFDRRQRWRFMVLHDSKKTVKFGQRLCHSAILSWLCVVVDCATEVHSRTPCHSWRGHAEEHWRCAIGGPWTVDIADTRPGGLITSEALACGLMMDALPRLNPMLFLAIRIAACLH